VHRIDTSGSASDNVYGLVSSEPMFVMAYNRGEEADAHALVETDDPTDADAVIVRVYTERDAEGSASFVFGSAANDIAGVLFEITAISAASPYDTITAKRLTEWSGTTPTWVTGITIRDVGNGCPQVADVYPCTLVSGIWTFASTPHRLTET